MTSTQLRQLAEIGAPGAVIGVLAGAVVGVMGVVAGQPVAWAVTGAVTIAVPLALFGALYGVCTALGYAKPGMFAPAAVLWLVGFPVSRLAYQTLTPVFLGGNPTPPDDVGTFLVFQALISLGFAIGFLWMYERIAPGWLRQAKEHNPYAAKVYASYSAHAEAMWNERELKRALRAARAEARRSA